MIGIERLLGRVKGARADVAENDTDRGQRQARQRFLETGIVVGHPSAPLEEQGERCSGLAPRRVHHFVCLASHFKRSGSRRDARELIRLEYALSVKPESNDQVQGRQYPPLVLCDNLSERRGRDPPNRRNERPRTRLP